MWLNKITYLLTYTNNELTVNKTKAAFIRLSRDPEIAWSWVGWVSITSKPSAIKSEKC